MPAETTYLDNNATTRPDPRVVAALLPYLTERFGNPSSAHRVGSIAADGVRDARAQVAALLSASPDEIVFTSGGTEADNAALRGVLRARPDRRHIVISAIEHHAIIETAEALEHDGVAVTHVPVDGDGRLDLSALRTALRPDTALVSIMLANNETGITYPLAEIARSARAAGALVHTDAVNALGKTPVDVQTLAVDLLSLSGHKIYGPKGVGALYVRARTPFSAWQIGGGQETGRRGGTLNVPGMVGLGQACELLRLEGPAERDRITTLRDRLETSLRCAFPDVLILGAAISRLPNTTCVCFPGCSGSAIVAALSKTGICVSSGAACTAGETRLSHVLRAMQLAPEFARGEVRISCGRYNTVAHIDRLLAALPSVVQSEECRVMSAER